MKRTLIVLTMALVVSVALALVRPGAVQSEAAAAESGSDAASSDAGALRRLRLDGAVEILAANSARLNARSSRVRQFAAEAERVYTRLNRELASIAEQANLNLAPAGAYEPHQASALRHAMSLDTLQGDAFDQQYVTVVAQHHEQALNAARRAVAVVQDPGLRRLFDRAVGQISALREEARRLQYLVALRDGRDGWYGGPSLQVGSSVGPEEGISRN